MFGGLLGVQKALNDKLKGSNDSLSAHEKQSNKDIRRVKRMTNQLTKMVERDRLSHIKSCIAGSTSLGMSGGQSLQCIKNVNGKSVKSSCGAIDFLASEIDQAARKTENGDVIKSTSRGLDGVANVTKFNEVAKRMLSDLDMNDVVDDKGTTKTVTGADGEGQEEQMFTSNVKSWSDITAKYGNAFAEISKDTKVDIKGQLDAIGGTCFNQGQDRKKQYMGSTEYQNQLDSIQTVKDEVNDRLDNDMKDINKLYGEGLNVLSGGKMEVSINRFNCTTTDPVKQMDCFKTMKNGLNDLLEGKIASNAKIDGAQLPPPFTVPSFNMPCQGINRCVAKYQAARKAMKSQLRIAGQNTSRFVNESNARINKQMSAIGTTIGGIQNQVKTQLGRVSALMGKMKISAKPEISYFDKDKGLKPQPEGSGPSERGPGTPPGPYGNNVDLGLAISASVPPDGLMKSDGKELQEIMTGANEKAEKDKTDAKEKLDKIAEKIGKIQDLSCGDEQSVKNGACGFKCSNYRIACTSVINASTVSVDEGFWKNISDVSSAVNKDNEATAKEVLAKIDNINDALSGNSDCVSKGQDCNTCVESKRMQFEEAQKKANNTSNDANH